MKFHFARCPWLVCVCAHVSLHGYRHLFAGESGRWVMRADGSPWMRLRGAGKDPAVGRALTHLGVSVAELLIKSITMMGSEMELGFGMAPYCGCCVCFCVCTSVCVCHFLVITLDDGCWAFCRLSRLYCIPCNYATTMSGQGHITGSLPSHIACYISLLCSIQTCTVKWA